MTIILISTFFHLLNTYSCLIQVAHTSHSILPQKESYFDKKTNTAVNNLTGNARVRVTIAADNGCLYVWDVEVPASHLEIDSAPESEGGPELDQDGMLVMKSAQLMAVVELPVSMTNVAALHTMYFPRAVGNRQARYVRDL